MSETANMSNKTVIVADDDPDVTQTLALRLEQLGLTVLRSPDATHALVGTQKMRPDLVILDVNMQGGNGMDVGEMLASDQEFANLPVIIHTGRDDELTRIRCMHPCHYYVKKSPRAWDEIKSIVCDQLNISGGGAQSSDTAENTHDATRGKVVEAAPRMVATSPPAAPSAPLPGGTVKETAAAPPPSSQAEELPDAKRTTKPRTVLCIDDDPDVSKSLQIRLAGYGVDVLRAFNGMQGYWTAVAQVPDVIICDMSMPEGDGNYIFGRLKSHPLTENIPVIVLTGQGNPALKRTMLSFGLDAFLNKPLVFDDLLRELRAFLDLPEEPQPAKRQDTVRV